MSADFEIRQCVRVAGGAGAGSEAPGQGRPQCPGRPFW